VVLIVALTSVALTVAIMARRSARPDAASGEDARIAVARAAAASALPHRR